MYCDKRYFLKKSKCDENEKSIERQKGIELGEKRRNSERKERE